VASAGASLQVGVLKTPGSRSRRRRHPRLHPVSPAPHEPIEQGVDDLASSELRKPSLGDAASAGPCAGDRTRGDGRAAVRPPARLFDSMRAETLGWGDCLLRAVGSVV